MCKILHSEHRDKVQVHVLRSNVQLRCSARKISLTRTWVRSIGPGTQTLWADSRSGTHRKKDPRTSFCCPRCPNQGCAWNYLLVRNYLFQVSGWLPPLVQQSSTLPFPFCSACAHALITPLERCCCCPHIDPCLSCPVTT